MRWITFLLLICVFVISGYFFVFRKDNNKDLLELEKRIVAGSTERFLLAYEAKDIEGLLQLFCRDSNILFYGVDLGDKARDIKDVRSHFVMLFSGIESLRFRNTKPDFVEISDEGKMAAVFCEIPMEIVFHAEQGNSAAVILRFVLIWKKIDGVWRIFQAGTFLATSGKSAQELSKNKSSKR